MNDDERTVEIERLFKERSEATARKTALLDEANEWAARIHEIRLRQRNRRTRSDKAHRNHEP
jgi:hypothetical protein